MAASILLLDLAVGLRSYLEGVFPGIFDSG
jgi:hypothetical protein